MSQEKWTAVDQYITDLLVPGDSILDATLDASAVAGLPPAHVAPNQGKLLLLLARMIKAKRILEIGTLGGYSTIWLARSLLPNGKLITLEADPRHAAIALDNFERAGLTHCIELRTGEALGSLSQLVAESQKPFDLIFIDADKPNNPAYLEWSLKLAHTGTLIVADNVVRDGAVIDARSGDLSVQGIRRFYELVAANPRLTATAVQTVGSKGYDGFAIALVT